MYVDLAQAGNSIRKGSSVPVHSGPGTQVLVLMGCVWVTQEGDGRDYILASGDAMRVSKTGLTLVMAIEDSRVSLVAPEKPNTQPSAPRYLSGGTVESLTNRAKQLRAEYIGHLAGRFKEKLRGAVSEWSKWMHHPGSI
jgi:Protein of unknown function (DUF2917)